MDDILKQMLVADQRASQLIKDAEAEAERIRIDGRRQVEERRNAIATAAETEARSLAEAMTATAQVERDREIETARRDMETAFIAFEREVETLLPEIIRTLARP
jgi:vacuolar-type H+-ATPase subunit E/Vma4